MALNLTSSLLHRTKLQNLLNQQVDSDSTSSISFSLDFYILNQEMSIFKMGKRVQPKSIRRQHHQRLFRHHLRRFHHPKRRSSSSTNTKSFSIIASISKSIHKCHLRLIKFFSKLATIGHHLGSVILERKETLFEPDVGPRLKFESETSSALPQVLVLHEHHQLLHPLVSDKKRTIVLDLDETLVHSISDQPPPTYDFMIKPSINGVRMKLYVLKRPGVDEFLEAISQKYEVVVFTAGIEPYASLLLDFLDPKGLISHRLYRDSCKQLVRGTYVKDLSKIGRDLGKVVIVDDNPKSYYLQPANAIPIKRFEDDIEDRELKKLIGFFQSYCDGFEDMRDAVKQYFGGANMS
ncbi:CTD small phosphatase-like protein 2 [Durio zibethinus]|uniref:CTD small phosphatase-like protein 2 n=1 Tax=Durio zibethinus TaxID=66656 RepID=A0A6P5WZ58_DURZI|nr:CTD small phosphatase-like protein 2 [Durio zibethinus]